MKTLLSKTLNFVPIIFISIFIIAGCTGPQGPMGNANVQTIQYVVTPGDWTGDTDEYDASLSVPEITQDIFNNGAVLLYSMYENATPYSFNLIPYTYVYNNETTYMDANIYVGSIDLFLRQISGGVNNTSQPTSNYIIKVVIIAGVNVSDIPVDVKNYAVLKKYYNLK
jgi:hypothetical protein